MVFVFPSNHYITCKETLLSLKRYNICLPLESSELILYSPFHTHTGFSLYYLYANIQVFLFSPFLFFHIPKRGSEEVAVRLNCLLGLINDIMS